MSEPSRFDPLDPDLVRLRSICLDLPGAAEKLVVGHPAFYTRKVFAYFGMSNKVDGRWVPNPRTVSVLLPEDERLALLEDPRVHIPGYIGPYGWISLHIDGDTDWGEVAELVELSYRQTAGVRLIARLDAR
ncbi:YjbR protein [Tessaracoccus bendigoensis DSM 12906]|uniref:YjbR protein n=1 Tax=Tessaracoccus bendigoensis DSM 12906 TaxID=1123357 RepID=A0A1M6GMH4_9ACTN|nr:MmcQ/YjbR family DNA-binding protein [Tessaracoccus bendigoensis]SHJ11148.1 YjbR protein [Tessaracoccus bendigoensis DSM 12906]